MFNIAKILKSLVLKQTQKTIDERIGGNDNAI